MEPTLWMLVRIELPCDSKTKGNWIEREVDVCIAVVVVCSFDKWAIVTMVELDLEIWLHFFLQLKVARADIFTTFTLVFDSQAVAEVSLQPHSPSMSTSLS